ncbi:hypothetical protein EDC01DRAFT_669814 [Geopyxis carbonaria]|nr:hypothetical protein EDC01DRAFT_669814 [Geopyxis carbonaria]
MHTKTSHGEVCIGMLPWTTYLSGPRMLSLIGRYKQPNAKHLELLISLNTRTGDNHPLKVFSQDGYCLGVFAKEYSQILRELLVRGLAQLPGVFLLPEQYSQSHTVAVDLCVNIFGKENHVVAIGRYFSDNDMCLQHPKYPLAGYPYKNPHLFNTKRYESMITECTLWGGVPTKASQSSSAAVKGKYKATVVDASEGIEEQLRHQTLY